MVMPIIMRMLGFAGAIRAQEAEHCARIDREAEVATAILVS